MRLFHAGAVASPAVLLSCGLFFGALEACGPAAHGGGTNVSGKNGGAPGDGAGGAAHPSGAMRAPVVDDYHGVKVDDRYRWLEDGDTPAVKAFDEAENARTRSVLDGFTPPAARDALKKDIEALLEIGTVGLPSAVLLSGGRARVFHTKKEGAANQPTLYVRDLREPRDETSSDRVLLDVSKLSADGTTSLDWWYPSPDGDKVAWGASESGSEESTLTVRSVENGADLPDKIPFTRHASVAWLPGGRAFYYSRYPTPGSVPAGDEKYFSKIYRHELGTDWKADPVVFGGDRNRTDVPVVMVSPNGRWLVVRVHEGWSKSEVYVMDLQAKPDKDGHRPKWQEVAVGTDAVFDPTPKDDRLWMRTNDGASRYRLFAVDYAHPDRTHWDEIIVEGKDVLTDAVIGDRVILANYMQDAHSRIERFALEEKPKKPLSVRPLGEVKLPGVGTSQIAAADKGDVFFASYASFVTPPRILGVDPSSGETRRFDQVGAAFASPAVDVVQRFARSKDGAKIPFFVVAPKNLVASGDHPTLLYGYGGFNVSQTPAFSGRALVTAMRGGVFVSAVLRGGGEFGEAWHRAGMLESKQHVFDDFAAVAEELIAEKVTSPDKLGILGGSNGGLLVAASVVQRPELFRAAVSMVPLTDMLRYQRFRIAQLWIPEYGSAEDETQFQWLYAYSPFHHVGLGRYPSVLFTTATSDSRVDPMHARKMAARMQDAQTAPDRPILLRVESKAGHGAGKPTAKVAEEWTDELGFVFHELGLRGLEASALR